MQRGTEHSPVLFSRSHVPALRVATGKCSVLIQCKYTGGLSEERGARREPIMPV